MESIIKVDLVKLLTYAPTFEEVDPGSDGQIDNGGGETPVGGGDDTPVDSGDDSSPVDGGGSETPSEGGGSETTPTTRYFKIAECGATDGPFYDVYYDGTFDIRIQDWAAYDACSGCNESLAWQVANGDAYNGYGAYFVDGSPNFYNTFENGNTVSKNYIIKSEYASEVPTTGFITDGWYDCLDAALQRESERLF